MKFRHWRVRGDVKSGDILVAINGRRTLAVADPEMLLRNQEGKQVLLDVKTAAPPPTGWSL